MFAIRRIVPTNSSIRRDEDMEAATINQQKSVPRWTRRFFATFPSWSILPLKGFVIVSFLMGVIENPRRLESRVGKAENEALIWPLRADPSTFDNLDQFNIVLDLVGIAPDLREVAFLCDLSPGGAYEHDTEPGMLDIDGGQSLAVTLGHQALEYDSGQVISDQNVVIIAEDTVPLYSYPFDEYKVEMTVRAVLINATSDADLIIAAIQGPTTNVNITLSYFEGEQGWLTTTSFEPLYDNNGQLVPGCVVMMTMRRSSSVKFFSLFVILLMWFISLALFVIGFNYAFSSSNEVAYDVPALMVGFLFALPFIRQVQPDVPQIGIIADIMGFFFNMILIALATVTVMAALTSRHYRATKAKIEASLEAHHRETGGEVVPGPTAATLKDKVPVWDPEAPKIIEARMSANGDFIPAVTKDEDSEANRNQECTPL